MIATTDALAKRLAKRFAEQGIVCAEAHGETTVEIPPEALRAVCAALRDEAPFRFNQLIDLCGVDYLEYGDGAHGRYAAVLHLLSLHSGERLRLRCFAADDDLPRIPSVIALWPAADWYEREAFDLFGILFDGHPDLRRILTDYGFIGHPFRKDFPVVGNVEARYDDAEGRVVYTPVTIEERVVVPRVIRKDHRYAGERRG